MKTVAALIGFTDPNSEKDPFFNLDKCIKDTFKWEWLDKPYILTKTGLMIGFILGIVSIVLS